MAMVYFYSFFKLKSHVYCRKCVVVSRGVASFSKVRGMDVVCLLTIKTINTMTEGYKRYNI